MVCFHTKWLISTFQRLQMVHIINIILWQWFPFFRDQAQSIVFYKVFEYVGHFDYTDFKYSN